MKAVELIVSAEKPIDVSLTNLRIVQLLELTTNVVFIEGSTEDIPSGVHQAFPV
jgi:hypothetical protein